MLAIIGGSGLTRLSTLAVRHRQVIRTPYGEPSAALVFGELAGQRAIFLARHGHGHTIPPHRVNYRANLWALRDQGASAIFAVASVGGIRGYAPGDLVLPHQLIDYTSGRQNTYFDGGDQQVVHVDFTHPYSARLRAPRGVIDQLVRQDQVAGTAARDGADRGDGQHRGRAALAEGPQVRAVVDAVRGDGVAMAMAGQEDGIAVGDLAEQQRAGGVAVGRADHLAMGHRQGGQARQTGAADDCKHEESGPAARRPASGWAQQRGTASRAGHPRGFEIPYDS